MQKGVRTCLECGEAPLEDLNSSCGNRRDVEVEVEVEAEVRRRFPSGFAKMNIEKNCIQFFFNEQKENFRYSLFPNRCFSEMKYVKKKHIYLSSWLRNQTTVDCGNYCADSLTYFSAERSSGEMFLGGKCNYRVWEMLQSRVWSQIFTMHNGL